MDSPWQRLGRTVRWPGRGQRRCLTRVGPGSLGSRSPHPHPANAFSWGTVI